ncbi:single-stranded DNA-binding protein 3 isoform X6 [Peromyscus maniculatus bairdii]|uniref:single-stranded DNA-binding protein 3 isoform X6 n=1 Tax=Peromyscus maniculatus bairdii TaxID=230844 RepID=UPI003FD0B816
MGSHLRASVLLWMASPWLLGCWYSSENVFSETDLWPPTLWPGALEVSAVGRREKRGGADDVSSGAGSDPLCSVSAAAAPSPVLGSIPPNDGMPGGPIPPGFFQPFMSPRYAGGPRPPIRMGNQPPGGVPGTQPLLPNSMDPTRQQGHPNMGGSMQRMNPPRGMGPMGPGPQTDPWLSLQNYGSGMRPPPNSLGPAMPGINMGPGAGRPWPNPNSANSIPYSSSSPGTYVGPPGGGGPPGTPIMPSPADSTNSSDNIYTMINPVPPGGSRSNFPMGPGSDGPMGGMGGMEPHHMNGSLGSGDIDGLPKNSPNNISGISNPPGTPRDDGELGGNFLHSFQNDNYSPSMTMSV